MMSSQRLKVLLVTPSSATVRFVTDGLKDPDATSEIIHVQWFPAAIERMARLPFDVVMLSLSVLGTNLAAVFKAIETALPDASILILASAQDESEAVRAIREGADDCVILDQFEDRSLRRMIDHTIERKQMLKEIQAGSSRGSLNGTVNFEGLQRT